MKKISSWSTVILQIMVLCCIIVLSAQIIEQKKEIETLKKENLELRKQVTTDTLITNRDTVSFDSIYSKEEFTQAE